LSALAHGPDCACPRCTGFPPGNRLSVKSGATGELSLAPVRVEMDIELARDYPHLDDRRRALLADRLARIALARTWLDGRGVVRDDEGRVFDVVDRLEKWSSRSETLLAGLEEEARAAAFGDPVARLIEAGRKVGSDGQ
jgi:hypothetical protein